jgi:hypothetical protein
MRGKDLMLSYPFRVLSNNMNDFWGIKAGGAGYARAFCVCFWAPQTLGAFHLWAGVDGV